MRARYLPRGGVACGCDGCASACGASTKGNLTQKEPGRLLPSPLACEIARSLAGVVLRSRVRSVVEQQSDHLLAALRGRAVESGEADVLPGVDVRTPGEELAHDLDVPAGDRRVQRRDSGRVLRGEVRVRAGGEQELGRLGVS